MTTTNQSNLIHMAIQNGAAKAGNWSAVRHWSEERCRDVVEVWHYGTMMFEVIVGVIAVVIARDSGWGSVSDKQGVRKITAGYGAEVSYAALFPAEDIHPYGDPVEML